VSHATQHCFGALATSRHDDLVVRLAPWKCHRVVMPVRRNQTAIFLPYHFSFSIIAFEAISHGR
jgi:hypothetical protein